MTVREDSPRKYSMRSWSELSKRYFQRRHLCSWILAAVLPFLVLRLVFFYDSEAYYTTPASTPDSKSETLEYRYPRFPYRSQHRRPHDKSPGTVKNPPLIRPDEDAWITHDEWINHQIPKGRNDKNFEKISPKEAEQGKHSHLQAGAQPPTEEIFGLPEDNDKQDAAAWFMTEEEEKNLTNNVSAVDKTALAEREKLDAEEHQKAEGLERAAVLKRAKEDAEIADRQKLEEDKKKLEEDKKKLEREKKKFEEEKKAQEERERAQEQKALDEQREVQIRKQDEEEKRKAEKLKAEELNRLAEEQRLTEERAGKDAEEKKRIEEQEAVERKANDEEAAAETREAEEKENAEEPRADEPRESEEKSSGNKQADEQVDKQDDSGQVEQVNASSETSEKTIVAAGECDLFEGGWEYDPEGPLYTNSTCFYIQGDQNCMSNGRPDTGFLHWKWKPRDCDLPRFDAKGFLEAFKEKTIGFVGDSLARNQMQSLLCMLSQVEVPIQTQRSPDDKSVRWLYPNYQVTLAVVWSPYMLKESLEGVKGFEKGQSVLYVDMLDPAWTSVLGDFDIIVLSMGQWYFKASVYVKDDEVIGCHYCPGLNLTEIGFYDAYRAGLRLVLEKVASELKGLAIMSTFAISHFEHGPWENGGDCRREEPIKEEEIGVFPFPGLHNEMRDIVMDEFIRISKDTSKHNKDVRLEFLDVTKVSLLRADGHPGPYRRPHPYAHRDPSEWVVNDCLHWCLPGPVDTWNQLLVKIAHRHF